MKVLIAVSGSRGDMQPSLALALALRRAGHGVTVAAAPNFQSWTESLGVPFVASGIDVESFMRERGARGDAKTMRGRSSAMRAFFEADIPKNAETLDPLVRDADLVVGVSLQVAARELCEGHRRPYCHLAFTAQLFPSSAHPPPLVNAHGLPRPLNALAWRVVKGLRSDMVNGPVNLVRARLGIAPRERYPNITESVALNLLATDAALDPVPADVRVRWRQTGFLFLEQDEPLAPDIEAFLADGPPPVYIGFGSMTPEDPAAVFAAVVDAVQRAGTRALVLAGWARLGDGAAATPPSIKVVGPVPHRALFPRMKAVVHHGGAGTTSAAALAGVPQLVVPHVLDQFMWARIVERAQLGPRSLPALKLTGPRLAARLHELLTKDLYAEAARALQPKLAARGDDAAVAALVELAHAERSGALGGR